MAFEVKKFKVFKKVVLPKNQTEKECEVEIGSDVSKILSASANVSLSSFDVKEGVIAYGAEVSTCVIYMTSDGRLGSANSICEYEGKVENSQIGAEDKAIVSLAVKESQVDFVNGNAIVKVEIEEMVELLCENEISNIDCSDDDVCTRKGSLSIEKFVGEGKGIGSTEEEIVARANVKKIVSLEPNVVIKSCETQKGSVVVAGDTIARLIYLTEDDKFEVTYVNASFKEEIEVENAEQGMRAICKAYVNLKDAVAEVLESDKSTKIVVKVPFAIKVYVFGEEEIDAIEDMYSTTNEVSLASESFDMTKVCENEILESKIDGGLTLSETQPRVDKIVFNGGNSILVTNAYVANRELTVEGIAKTTVVYLNDDEGSLNSVEIEIPFVISDKTNASDDVIVCADAILYDTDVSVKRGREIFFDGKVKVNARVCQEEISATITTAERGEEIAEKDCAMLYVYGKTGETLWEVAKRNKVKEEQLVYQNSDVTFPLVQDTGFILFFQKLM